MYNECKVKEKVSGEINKMIIDMKKMDVFGVKVNCRR